MADIIVIMIIAACVGLAIGYMYRLKKKGGGCMGCPYSGSCSKNADCSRNNK